MEETDQAPEAEPDAEALSEEDLENVAGGLGQTVFTLGEAGATIGEAI